MLNIIPDYTIPIEANACRRHESAGTLIKLATQLRREAFGIPNLPVIASYLLRCYLTNSTLLLVILFSVKKLER